MLYDKKEQKMLIQMRECEQCHEKNDVNVAYFILELAVVKWHVDEIVGQERGTIEVCSVSCISKRVGEITNRLTSANGT